MTFDVERAASLLASARRAHVQVEPPSPGPADVQDAYAVQDAVARQLGPIGGWKVGAKTPVETPSAAPLLADLVRTSPVIWPSSSLHMIGIEAEIAFRLGRDIEIDAAQLAPEDIWASIASVHAAIEIVDTRLANWARAERLWLLADNQSNGGFVYDPAECRPDQSFADAPYRLTIDGRIAAQGRGGNPAGDPGRLVEWLVNHCVQRRAGIRAGAFVTTGSCTGMLFVEPGATVRAEFGGIGSVEVRFER
jgi:2-keto-4-pentenoate hydratase